MTGFIVNVFPFRNRVSSKEAFEGLELGEGKLSRPVLRGPGGRKAAWLLGDRSILTRSDSASLPRTGLLERRVRVTGPASLRRRFPWCQCREAEAVSRREPCRARTTSSRFAGSFSGRPPPRASALECVFALPTAGSPHARSKHSLRFSTN